VVVDLDDRGLPTGSSQSEDAEDEPLGTRAFDDLYELDDDRRLAVTAGGRRLAVVVGDGYRYAQVFAPPATAFVCLEPMTAPVNALVNGGLPARPPGRIVHGPIRAARRGRRLTGPTRDEPRCLALRARVARDRRRRMAW
jgi:galactose mutarotase-like enzyme